MTPETAATMLTNFFHRTERPKAFYLSMFMVYFGFGTLGCGSAGKTADDAKTAVDLNSPAQTTKAKEAAAIVFFEGEAKNGVPPEVDEFLMEFFETLQKDWRGAIRFMDQENYKESFASSPGIPAIENDAAILALSISLHRFHGDGQPEDKDSHAQRLQAISKVRITKFEQNEQVYQLGGETKVKDGRVYGLTMVIAKGKLGILCPL